jgi:Uma2 family endonuclease
MSKHTTVPVPADIDYPETDGQPMAENTLQFQWIVTIQGNLDELFPAVFVAGDLFWYPVEGDNTICTAPDILVAFGRPKGYRGSYRQWEEGDVAPQVVFEVLSPGNRPGEMEARFAFYERYGVEEYYVIDPPQESVSRLAPARGKVAADRADGGLVQPPVGYSFRDGERGDPDLSSGRPALCHLFGNSRTGRAGAAGQGGGASTG